MSGTPTSDADSRVYVSAAARIDNVGQNGSQEEVQKIVAAGPWGAMAFAGVAVLALLVVWLAFFFLVFLPRGPIG